MLTVADLIRTEFWERNKPSATETFLCIAMGMDANGRLFE